MSAAKSPGGNAGVPKDSGGGGAAKKYVDLKQEKFHYPDGRRGIRFYVVDSEGKSHFAVLGEERDTRDGHYMYRKQASFPAGADLVCGNLAGVHKWARDVMIESGCADSAIDFKPLRRGSALGGAAEASHHKKQRHLKDEIERLIGQAKELEQSNMKAFEIQYTSVIKTARSTAKAFLKDEVTQERTQAFIAALEKVKQNALRKGKAGGGSKQNAAVKLVEELQQLRVLSDTYLPLQLLDSSNAYTTIDEIEQSCPNKAVVALCTQIKAQWRLMLRKHLIVSAVPWDEYPIGFGSSFTTHAKRRGPHSAGGAGVSKAGGKRGAYSSHATPKKSHKSSTGIGKGRKICHHCNQIVGSPSRICPFCKGELPLKTTPKSAAS